MNNVKRVFNRLLTDISDIMNVPLKAPHDVDIPWILYEGPRLDKILLRYLEDGKIVPDFPEWLMPLWDIFDETKSPLILKNLRQILVFGYKAETAINEIQQAEAQASFIETDCNLDAFDQYFCTAQNEWLFIEARKLISRITSKIDLSSIVPTHGPGAVFPPCLPRDKSRFNTIYTPIDALYPFYWYFQMTSSQIENAGSSYKGLKVVDEVVAKLTCVPKDSRGPRLISVHPKESVWIQQGIRRVLEDAIDRSPLTAGRINFSDQGVNGNIALNSSYDRRFATIDLKDASDTISKSLTDFLFGSHSVYLNSCRATQVELFDGALHRLRKFAPMGNATTFPVESLVFWAVAVSGIRCHYGVVCSDVYVFGDDICVPTQYYEGVIKALVRAGLRPNPSKCFHEGHFRESCGIDAYKGCNVTPTRLKKHAGNNISDLTSMCAVAKRLRLQGYESAAAELYNCVRKKFRRCIPKGNNVSTSGIYEYVVLGLYELMLENGHPNYRWNESLHRYESRVFLSIPVIDKMDSHDWNHVMDSLLGISPNRLRSTGHQYTVPHRTSLVEGWTPMVHARVELGHVLSLEQEFLLREERVRWLGVTDL